MSIKGLAGKKSLRGKVKIQGAKNAVLKAISAAVLFDGPVMLENVPDTDDVDTLSRIMGKIGAKVATMGKGKMTIDTSSIDSTVLDKELATNMRASVTLTGPLLARFGSATFPKPGGCIIGERPIDLFIDSYKKMGATVEEDGSYDIKAEKGLKGVEIFFNKQTVGGTETIMLASVLVQGKTILKNCAMEPEISSLAEWLNECGADIKGAGTTTIEINGTGGKLLKPVKPYVTIPDRIEAGSFLILGALCAEELEIESCEPAHMEAVINILKDVGVPITFAKSSIKITGNTMPNSSFKAVNDLRTHEYPGFPTDLQAPMTVFLTQVSGTSNVFETIYEDRFKYVDDLNKLGAKISVKDSREITVVGPTSLKQSTDSNTFQARDIRAGFAIVLATLIAEGDFVIENTKLINRGYEDLMGKLKGIGVVV